ncbi:hypothetical protein V491_03511 [Pseudogymnoascus sp. VKM F-3775]|nr:hypothetical protein V491_03511 [Pseudogymnoascus sp. VKM F-3775]
MTPTPAEYEIKRRPVWDPAPGTACIWDCITQKPLSMHRLSDRVIGGLYIAIDCGFIRKSHCNMNESDLGKSFKIRLIRTNLNLGHGLLTPDGKAVVSIPVKREAKTTIFELRGASKANANLPAVAYNKDIFKSTYPNWSEWRDELLYCRKSDGSFKVEDFESYPRNATDSTPLDWPQGLTRDRILASEAHYRLLNLNTKTELSNDAASTENNARSPYLTRSQTTQPTKSNPRTPQLIANSLAYPNNELSVTGIIDERYGIRDRKGKAASNATGKALAHTDSEDEISTLVKPKKRKRSMLRETPSGQVPPSPAIAPIEVHKAAFQAAFRDKSVKRTELFQALLPYITVANAEEILYRCKQVAAVLSESKFE